MFSVKYFPILILFVAVAALSSCHKSFYLDVMHPAEVILENDMDTLVLVDRTNNSKGLNGAKGKLLEAVVTKSIKTGGNHGDAMVFLADRIKVNDRLSLATDDIIKINKSNYGNSVSKPIPSIIVDSICLANNASGIISLERIITEEKGTTASDHLRLTHTTWKLYAPNDMLIDEIVITTYGQSKPLKDIPSTVTIVNSAIKEAALTYLRRITPEYYRESRSYYTGGLANMKLAKKAMKSKDYASAKQYWEALAAKPGLKKKIQAQLAFNLALSYEIEGNLEKSLNYAKQAHKKGIPTALRYIEQLELQILEKPILEIQLVRE